MSELMWHGPEDPRGRVATLSTGNDHQSEIERLQQNMAREDRRRLSMEMVRFARRYSELELSVLTEVTLRGLAEQRGRAQ